MSFLAANPYLVPEALKYQTDGSGLVFLSEILSHSSRFRSRSTDPALANFYHKFLPQYYPSKILINDMLLFCSDIFVVNHDNVAM